MSKTRHFLCRGTEDREALARDIAAGGDDPLPLRYERGVLDTFDLRLAARDWLLTADRGAEFTDVRLANGGGRELVRARLAPDATAADVARHPRLHAVLAPVVEVRALLERARWPVVARECAISDDAGKILGALVVEEHGRAGDAHALTVSARPKRGYAEAFRRRVEDRLPRGAEALERDFSATLGERLGVLAAPEPQPRLAADDAPVVALARLLGRCQRIMRANEAGMREDLDIEFLHDFRVAMRRARALLASFRAVVAVPAPIRKDFAWLSAATGPLRDLDVWTSEFEPAGPSDPVLVDYVAARRREARRRLLRVLDSSRYGKFHARFAAHVDDLGTRAVDGEARLDDFVAGQIWSRYRRLRKAIRHYDDAVEPPVLHELRKDAKKLRYLLDGFRALFPERVMAPSIAELKAVQNTAGVLCDHDARTQLTRRWLDDCDDPAVCDSLLASLEAHRLPPRIRFKRKRFRALGDALARFTSKASAARYRKTFRRRA
ncbi:MAG: CHAD domain-containing protein [Gammaproteobacteria bacterium]